MVANYTSLKKKRKSDDYTPGQQKQPGARDRAVIVICQTCFPALLQEKRRPIVLGKGGQFLI